MSAAGKILRLAALAQDDILRGKKAGHPDWGAHCVISAATAVVVTAAAVVIGNHTVIATAAEQDQKDDDPAHVTTAEVIVAHNGNLQNIYLAAEPLIPRYSALENWCKKTGSHSCR